MRGDTRTLSHGNDQVQSAVSLGHRWAEQLIRPAAVATAHLVSQPLWSLVGGDVVRLVASAPVTKSPVLSYLCHFLKRTTRIENGQVRKVSFGLI